MSAARTSRPASPGLSQVERSRHVPGRSSNVPIRSATTSSPNLSAYIRPSASENAFVAP